MSSDGTGVVITDLGRGMTWELDPASRIYRPYREEYYQELTNGDIVSGELNLPRRELGPGRIVETTATTIRVQFQREA